MFAQREVRADLESVLPDYLNQCRWYIGNGRAVQSTHIVEIVPVPYKNTEAQIIWLEVEYIHGEPQTYVLLLACAEGEQAQHLLSDLPHTVIAKLQIKGQDETKILYEAIADKDFLSSLLNAIVHNHSYQGKRGELVASVTTCFLSLRKARPSLSQPCCVQLTATPQLFTEII